MSSGVLAWAPAPEAALEELERHRTVDVEARLARARAIAAEAEQLGDERVLMRARLVMADMLHRSGGTANAARLAAEVNGWATANRAPELLRRSHLVLSSILTSIGDAAAALNHAVSAVDLLADGVDARERANLLVCLADALAVVGSCPQARQRYQEATALFACVGDTERELNVLNNAIVMECEQGNTEEAAAAAARLAERSYGNDDMNPSWAETIARALMAVGDLAGAQTALGQGFALLDVQGDTQAAAPAELMLTEAEVLLAQARLDDAEDALKRCLAVCRARNLAGLRVEALRVHAEIKAAKGEFQSAYEIHRAFHEEGVALRNRQDEAAARTRHALFETEEARREAQRFWHQARTDPLTELYNRRFVDETLPRYLDTAGPRQPITAAIVDIDHFKAINDTFTHAIGDRVLAQLAVLLRSSTGAGGGDHPAFAARLGGEEFLVVLTADHRNTVGQLDALRRRVERFDWAAVHDGLAVTLSIGVAVARAGDTQSTLLARADEHLYVAKTAGRNRVVADH